MKWEVCLGAWAEHVLWRVLTIDGVFHFCKTIVYLYLSVQQKGALGSWLSMCSNGWRVPTTDGTSLNTEPDAQGLEPIQLYHWLSKFFYLSGPSPCIFLINWLSVKIFCLLSQWKTIRSHFFIFNLNYVTHEIVYHRTRRIRFTCCFFKVKMLSRKTGPSPDSDCSPCPGPSPLGSYSSHYNTWLLWHLPSIHLFFFYLLHFIFYL